MNKPTNFTVISVAIDHILYLNSFYQGNTDKVNTMTKHVTQDILSTHKLSVNTSITEWMTIDS